MKFLFDNLIEDCTLSNTNESVNYPVTNLAHVFLEKRYQAASGYLVDTIIGEWDDDVSIDSWFVGFHTLTSYEVIFYDYEDSPLYTLTVSSPNDIDFHEFTQVDDIRYFEMSVVFSAAPAYIGGLGTGILEELTDFETNYSLDVDDTSDFVESSYGQTLQTPRAILREYKFSFQDKTLAQKDAFMIKYYAIGKGKPIFVAFFNEDTTDISPLYAKFTRQPAVEKNFRRFNIEIQMKEAR